MKRTTQPKLLQIKRPIFSICNNLALRDHKTNDTSTNRRNFIDLVNLFAKYDPVLPSYT